MRYDPYIHKRKSIRLKQYNYANEGLYFVTICIQNRECICGSIEDGEMKLNNIGIMFEKEWRKLEDRFQQVKIKEYILMPNHFHGIVSIEESDTKLVPVKLGNIIGAYKSITTKNYVQNIELLNWKPFERSLWQRNYYEHIIRDNNELCKIQEYILNNPLKWDSDEENPDNN